jgi:hypothetical protein
MNLEKIHLPSKYIALTLIINFSIVPVFSVSAAAAVTFDIVTGSAFVGQTTGPIGDLYWEGGANDSPLNIFFDPMSSGLNTIGSTGIFLAYDNLTNFNFLFESLAVGNTVFNTPTVYGSNQISSLFRDAETIGVADGVSGVTQSLVGTNNFVITNPNNTYSYTDLITEDANYTYSSSTLNAYWLAAGQDAALIFQNADPSIFLNALFGDIDPSRLVANFEYLATQVDPLWTILNFEFFTTVATAKDPMQFQDFEGVGVYSYVSTDPGASPVPLPATIWILASGLLGMLSLSRRTAR